jgi:hypothetical protein
VAVNLIVAAVTFLMAGFVAIWIARPRYRAWIEAPRFQPLRWDAPTESDKRDPTERGADSQRG